MPEYINLILERLTNERALYNSQLGYWKGRESILTKELLEFTTVDFNEKEEELRIAKVNVAVYTNRIAAVDFQIPYAPQEPGERMDPTMFDNPETAAITSGWEELDLNFANLQPKNGFVL
jgi:hypothetical protein